MLRQPGERFFPADHLLPLRCDREGALLAFLGDSDVRQHTSFGWQSRAGVALADTTPAVADTRTDYGNDAGK